MHATCICFRPIHSSFNRRYFADRPLPTPLIPSIHQNGDGPLFASGTESDNEAVDGTDADDSPKVEPPISNRSYHHPRDDSTERPPTPEAPQLRRKAKGAVITFHFPVTEISPDSPSSDWTISGAREQRSTPRSVEPSPLVITNAVASDGGEWGDTSCVYAGTTDFHPSQDNCGLLNVSAIGSAFEGANDLDDNVSEDSYHLSEHEDVKDFHKQQTPTVFSPLNGANSDNNKTVAFSPVGGVRSDLSPPEHIQNYRFSPPPVSMLIKPVEIPSSSSAASVSSVSPPPQSQNLPSSRGLAGPLPGKVLSKVPVISAKPKPIVPPKPKIRVQNDDADSDAIRSDQPAVVILSKSTIVTKEISFNSSDLVSAPRTTQAIMKTIETQQQSVPTIEVDSEESPDIRHKIINGDIPYVLHMRRVTDSETEISSSAQPLTFSTFKDPSIANCTLPMNMSADSSRDYAFLLQNRPSANRSRPPNRAQSAKSRRKSLELVPRKRLPSPANFSSQDHSVSPDSEHDVVSFVSKWRNSSDGRKPSSFDKRTNKRSDPRRLTQPVKLFTPLAPAEGSMAPLSSFKDKKTVRSQPCLPINDDDSGDEFNMDSPSLHDSMEALEKMDVERISNSDLDSPTAEDMESHDFELKRTPLLLPYSPRPGSLDPPFIDDDSSKSESKPLKPSPSAERSQQFDDCTNLLTSAAESLRKTARQVATDV